MWCWLPLGFLYITIFIITDMRWDWLLSGHTSSPSVLLWGWLPLGFPYSIIFTTLRLVTIRTHTFPPPVLLWGWLPLEHPYSIIFIALRLLPLWHHYSIICTVLRLVTIWAPILHHLHCFEFGYHWGSHPSPSSLLWSYYPTHNIHTTSSCIRYCINYSTDEIRGGLFIFGVGWGVYDGHLCSGKMWRAKVLPFTCFIFNVSCMPELIPIWTQCCVRELPKASHIIRTIRIYILMSTMSNYILWFWGVLHAMSGMSWTMFPTRIRETSDIANMVTIISNVMFTN